MALPDAEAMVRAFLVSEFADETVTTTVPSPRPARFVRVWRTGGASMSRVVDEPLITVEAWAASKGAAAELGSEVRDVLLTSATKTALPLVRRIDAGAFYYDPDPTSGADRYSFTVSMRVRATRA